MPVRTFTTEEAKRIGDSLKIDWNEVNLEEFRMGLEAESDHGSSDPRTNVTNDDELTMGKIAWAHLNEFPDFYTRHAAMEREAEAYWKPRGWPKAKAD